MFDNSNPSAPRLLNTLELGASAPQSNPDLPGRMGWQ